MKLILFMLSSLLMSLSCNKDEVEMKKEPPTEENVIINVVVGNKTFSATLYDNTTTNAFKAMLPLTLDMSDFNRNEKVASLPRNLITNASNPRTIHTGDIMLYGSGSLVLFYETFSTSYSYTPIGRIDDISGLKAALGSGNVTIKFELK